MGHRQSDALAAWQEWNDARDHKKADAFARRIKALENPMSERDIEQLDGSAGPAPHKRNPDAAATFGSLDVFTTWNNRAGATPISTPEVKELHSWCDDGGPCND